MVSQSGVLSREPGATHLPSKPMTIPAIMTPMISTGDPFHPWGAALLPGSSGYPSGRGFNPSALRRQRGPGAASGPGRRAVWRGSPDRLSPDRLSGTAPIARSFHRGELGADGGVLDEIEVAGRLSAAAAAGTSPAGEIADGVGGRRERDRCLVGC